jgi:hypothetical protein
MRDIEQPTRPIRFNGSANSLCDYDLIHRREEERDRNPNKKIYSWKLTEKLSFSTSNSYFYNTSISYLIKHLERMVNTIIFLVMDIEQEIMSALPYLSEYQKP